MSNPCKETPQPYIDEEKQWLFAETGRLHLSLTKANKEIERLKALIPPDDTSFLGQAWSPFAEKLRLERDALREELDERNKEIEELCKERPAVLAWLQRMARNARHWGGKNDDRAEIYDRLADVFECGEHRKESTDQFGRTLPLEGHHKDCGHGKDGWSMCTCDKLRNRDARQFSELMNEVDTSTLTTSHVSNPKCSKCGDTGLVQVAPNARGVKQCDCAKERPSPLAESVTRAFQQSAADAVRTILDRGGTAVGEVQGQWQVVSKTCDHGNTECKRCGVGQPTIKTPEGKPLLFTDEFSAMQIKKNKELGLAECNFQRRTGRTTAMVLEALEFVKDARGRVNVEVHNPTMKKRVKELLRHYADELGVQHDQLSLIRVRAPGEYSPGVALNLRDNVFDDMKENKPTRDSRQDLKMGEHVRFEIEGIITARQSAGIVKDYDGNDFELVLYVIRELISDNNICIPYNKILNVIGKEK